jgi:hypothetical protein
MAMDELATASSSFMSAVEASCAPSTSTDSKGVQELEQACQTSVDQLRRLLQSHAQASARSTAQQAGPEADPSTSKPQEIKVGCCRKQLNGQ